jgi:hypothetical protein
MQTIWLACGDIVRHRTGVIGMVEKHVPQHVRVRIPLDGRLDWDTWDPRDVVAYVAASRGKTRWRALSQAAGTAEDAGGPNTAPHGPLAGDR